MDIEILLALQNFRDGIGSIFISFLNKMTFFGEMNTALVVLAIVYWCVNRKVGTYLLMGWNGNRLVNGLLKVTACVYRPWIRDARIQPYPPTKAAATGYSFPSGHAMTSASLYGGGVVRKEVPMILRIALGLFVFLISFSRIFLGVHTPQDILVGMCSGLLVMWLTDRLLKWLELHPEKDMTIFVAGAVLAVSLALYAGLKSYPVDYDEMGNLIVDGAKMANDTFKAVGWVLAFLVGFILERRHINFSTDISLNQRLTRLVIGLLGFYAINLVLEPLFKAWISGPVGTTICCFTEMFYIVYLFPLLFRYLDRKATV